MSKSTYFELHVTLAEDDPRVITGWTHSKIDGDPDLGAGARYYRTAHTRDAVKAQEEIEHAREIWPNALRYKIEHVIYDLRRPARKKEE